MKTRMCAASWSVKYEICPCIGERSLWPTTYSLKSFWAVVLKCHTLIVLQLFLPFQLLIEVINYWQDRASWENKLLSGTSLGLRTTDVGRYVIVSTFQPNLLFQL